MELRLNEIVEEYKILEKKIKLLPKFRSKSGSAFFSYDKYNNKIMFKIEGHFNFENLRKLYDFLDKMDLDKYIIEIFANEKEEQ